MDLVELGEVDLVYTSLESLDYESGGQLYGTMDGTLRGERLSGALRLTNLAARRADNVNLPTLRGVLSTNDGATIWVELDGIATLRPEDEARVFVTTFRFALGTRPTAGSTRHWQHWRCSRAYSTRSASAAPLAGASSPASRRSRSWRRGHRQANRTTPDRSRILGRAGVRSCNSASMQDPTPAIPDSTTPNEAQDWRPRPSAARVRV